MSSTYLISKKYLVILVAVAIVLAFTSITLTLDRLGVDGNILTGYASNASGVVTVTVKSSTSIRLINNTVQFGTGTLSGGSSGTLVNTTSTANPNTFDEPGDFEVQNDGSLEVNVSINGSTANQFLDANSLYQWAGATGQGGCGAENLTTTITSMTNAITVVCGNLSFASGNDTFNISIFLNISSNVSVATHTDDKVNFHAVSIN